MVGGGGFLCFLKHPSKMFPEEASRRPTKIGGRNRRTWKIVVQGPKEPNVMILLHHINSQLVEVEESDILRPVFCQTRHKQGAECWINKNSQTSQLTETTGIRLARQRVPPKNGLRNAREKGHFKKGLLTERISKIFRAPLLFFLHFL